MLWGVAGNGSAADRPKPLGGGHRTAGNGTLWKDYPNAGGSSSDIPLKLVTDNPRQFRLSSTQVSGDGLSWVAASGVSGVKSITVPFVIRKETAEIRPLEFVADIDQARGKYTCK